MFKCGVKALLKNDIQQKHFLDKREFIKKGIVVVADASVNGCLYLLCRPIVSCTPYLDKSTGEHTM